MGLMEEERRKIYEEEKARIEARERIEKERQAKEAAKARPVTPYMAVLYLIAGALAYLLMYVIYHALFR